MMKKIKRYNLEEYYDEQWEDYIKEMVPSSKGEWVHYEDVKDLIAQLVWSIDWNE